MARGAASRGRRRRRALAAVAVSGTALLLPAGVSAAAPARSGIRLPVPVEGVDPLGGIDLGLRKDRLLKSAVPGPVRDDENVTVAVGPTGAPALVTDEQRLVITAAGNYIVRELGPARAAVGLGGTLPPVLELGTVVWQGFSPDRRALAARLTLDPGIEAARLPMRVSLTFTDTSGQRRPLRPGGRAPADGTVTMTLSNNTASTRVVDAGVAEPGPLAGVLDRLRRGAARPRTSGPPVAGDGLPRVVPGARVGRRSLEVVAPLRVTGTITAPGGSAAVQGPGTSAAAGGVALEGTLTGDATFTVAVTSGDRLGLHLDVRPWIDGRTLTPPGGARSWHAWAGGRPSRAELTQATDTMVTAAATAARAAEYSPYLQADTPGTDRSTFTYVVAAPAATQRADDGPQPRPGAITAAVVALLAVAGNAALLRRQF
jgi:hypothetical protein